MRRNVLSLKYSLGLLDQRRYVLVVVSAYQEGARRTYYGTSISLAVRWYACRMRLVHAGFLTDTGHSPMVTFTSVYSHPVATIRCCATVPDSGSADLNKNPVVFVLATGL